MPGGTGVELALAVRELRPEIRVLLMSGYASTVEEEDEPWMEFLQKPFSPEQLRDRLEEVLS
jgi:DNA-binding NtrC family response regulator